MEMNVALFWSRVDVTTGCWLWAGGKNNKGYGRYGPAFAHRIAYELLVGPIPEGLELDHLCRTPLCVRPDHLEPVTHRENLLRGDTFAARNAAKTQCDRGHPYTADSIYVSKNGKRQCQICRNQLRREKYIAHPQTHCKRGHPLDDAYMYQGARHCRPCNAERQRQYMARRRSSSR